MFVSSYRTHAPKAAPPPVDTTPLGARFTLTTSATSGTYPFTAGLVFAQGEVPAGFVLDVAQHQAVVKRLWPDGSVKHAIVSGRAALTQNVARTVSASRGTPASGTALTAASIQTSAPSASIQCGAFGTVALSSLLATPFRTWVSGPEMVECHYRADVGGGTLLSAWFHVRLFADGRVWVRAIVENGYLDNGAGSTASNADRSYTATVVIGGSTVYNAAVTHYQTTRWSVEGWVGGDPAVTPLHGTAPLKASKLVPNYAYGAATSTTLNALNQVYTPMEQGDFAPAMEGTGFQTWIGLLPNWNALYVNSGDARAYQSTLANSSALNGRAIVWRDKTTNNVARPSDFPTWTIFGPGAGGADTQYAGASTLSWDQPHCPNEGYLAYLLTGDYWHYETMALGAANHYFFLSSARGSGTSRTMRPTQIRGIAWMLRSVGSYCAVAPTGDAIAADYRTWLANGYTYWASQGPENGSASQLGYPVAIGTYDPLLPLSVAPWMYHFWIQTNGFLSDIGTGLADLSKLVSVRDWMYKAVVGILGDNGTANFCYTAASNYNLTISATVRPDFAVTTPDVFYATWGEVFTATTGSSNTACGTSLGGSSGGDPTVAPTGYWGNLLPAIAYAVDHGATNANAAWLRLVGATNWSTVDGSGFPDTPVWGIKPRNPPTGAFVPPYSLPTTINTSTQVSLNTLLSIQPTKMPWFNDDPTYATEVTTVGAWCSGIYCPGAGTRGKFIVANSGGHGDRANQSFYEWSVETGLWDFVANTNGVTDSGATTGAGGTNGSPYYEISGSSPPMPAPTHIYANQAYIPPLPGVTLFDGAQGSIINCGRVHTSDTIITGAVHRADLATHQWDRVTNSLFSPQTGTVNDGLYDESSNVYDSVTGRVYIVAGNAAQTDLSIFPYLRLSDRTIQRPTVSTAGPAINKTGFYTKGFIFQSKRMILQHAGSASNSLGGIDITDDTTIATGWRALTVSGTLPGPDATWVEAGDGNLYFWDGTTANQLWKLVPPAGNKMTGTWTVSTLTIGGAGLPVRTTTGQGNSPMQHMWWDLTLQMLCVVRSGTTTPSLLAIKVT